MAKFSDVFSDETKRGRKLQTNEYEDYGKYQIIDQGQVQIAGYTNFEEGLFRDVPAIIFGDHTRIIKYVDKPFFLGADGVKVLRCKIKETDYKYLYYYLQSIKIPNTGYNRHFKWLKESEINLPPIIKQKEIAAILDKVNDLICTRAKQISLFDDLVKSQFIEMFGNITDSSCRFKTLKLGAVADVGSSHRVFTKEFVNIGIPFYRGTEIGELANNRRPTNLLYISEERYKKLASDETKAVIGDLLMPSICNKGQIWMVDTDAPFYYKDGRVLHISPNKQVYNPRYLQYFMKVKTEFEYPFMSSGSTFAEFKIFQLRDLDILTPPRKLQDMFAAIVEQVDKSKFEIQKSKNALETLKNALMQKYFSSQNAETYSRTKL